MTAAVPGNVSPNPVDDLIQHLEGEKDRACWQVERMKDWRGRRAEKREAREGCRKAKNHLTTAHTLLTIAKEWSQP